MKKVFIPIWFATALAAFALTDECDLLCDETFWKTATKDSVLELVSAGADVNISDGLGGHLFTGPPPLRLVKALQRC